MVADQEIIGFQVKIISPPFVNYEQVLDLNDKDRAMLAELLIKNLEGKPDDDLLLRAYNIRYQLNYPPLEQSAIEESHGPVVYEEFDDGWPPYEESESTLH